MLPENATNLLEANDTCSHFYGSPFLQALVSEPAKRGFRILGVCRSNFYDNSKHLALKNRHTSTLVDVALMDLKIDFTKVGQLRFA